jgi:hypothetical protein
MLESTSEIGVNTEPSAVAPDAGVNFGADEIAKAVSGGLMLQPADVASLPFEVELRIRRYRARFCIRCLVLSCGCGRSQIPFAADVLSLVAC